MPGVTVAGVGVGQKGFSASPQFLKNDASSVALASLRPTYRPPNAKLAPALRVSSMVVRCRVGS